MRRSRPRGLAAVGAVVTAILAAAACGDDDGGDERSIDVFGPYLASEADAFAASLLPFELESGVRVNYTGSGDFASDLRARVENVVDRPDVAIVPQPGIVAELYLDDELVAFDEDTLAAIEASFGDDADGLDLGDGVFALPYRESVKSIVWFRPDLFEEHGWTVPSTLDELADLVEQIEATEDAPAPWCFSIFAGSSTGWPATDWIEDLVLRRAGPDAYDRWVRGELEFDSDEVRAAFDELDELVLTRGRVAGGLRAILQTEVEAASAPLFEDPPGCVLYKQASFADSWFPDDAEIGPDGDVDFFVLPGADADEPSPIVTAGDLVVQMSDDEAVHDLVAYLATPEGAAAWAEIGGYTSARTSVDTETYYDEVDGRFAELLTDERESRFDGSDLMPPDIGSDLLWEELTLWIAGTRSLDDLVDTIDDAYEQGGTE